MGNIPSAEISPRIVNGVLKWYEGDTFILDLSLELVDQDDEHIEIGPDAVVKIVFMDRHGAEVKTFTFSDITGNTVTMEFDGTVTALFPAGKYFYDVFYTAEDRTTLADRNQVLVE